MTIRWGIIGCGDVTEVKSGPAFSEAAGSTLIAVMRRNGAKAEDYAKRHDVPYWFANADQLIEHQCVDAVYIATPPESHLELALKVCAAGKPTYVEKPIARRFVEAEQMVTAFQRAEVPLFIAYYRRAFARYATVKSLIESGALGDLTSIAYRYSSHPSFDLNNLPWRIDPKVSGGGLFMDIGCHVLDLLDFILGPLSEVQGLASATNKSTGVEDCVVLTFRTISGALGTGSWNFTSFLEEDLLEFVGTKGSLRTTAMTESPVFFQYENGTDIIELPNPNPVQLDIVQSVVWDLNGVGVCTSTGVSALRTSRIMDDVLSSFYGGRDDEFWLRVKNG